MFTNLALQHLFRHALKQEKPIDPSSTPVMFYLQFPSQYLPSCNVFFEVFILRCGTRNHIRLLKNKEQSAHFFIQRYSKQFFFKLVDHCSPYRESWQKFYIRLFLHWEGTNNTGLEFLSLAGLCCSRTTFYKYKSTLLQKEIAITNAIVANDDVKVFWFDNYNVNYYLTTQPTQYTSQINYNGTGYGCSFVPGVKFKPNCHNVCISPSILNNDNWCVMNVESHFVSFSIPRSRYFKESLSLRERMLNTPMKPNLGTQDDYSTMKFFRPIDIKKFNPSDDEGLLSALHHLDKTICAGYRGRIVVKCDLNIMYRAYKVCEHILYVISVNIT